MSKLEPWMVEYLRGHVGTLEYAGVELLKIAAAISAELERGEQVEREERTYTREQINMAFYEASRHWTPTGMKSFVELTRDELDNMDAINAAEEK